MLTIIFGVGLIKPTSAHADESSEFLACTTDSDCESGNSCRSRKGGGTECRSRVSGIAYLSTDEHSQQCFTDSDCPSNQSCRSKSKGGTMCKLKSYDTSSASMPPQASNPIPESRSNQEGYQFLKELAGVLSGLGQQMQNSGQQMQQNIMAAPIPTPNFQPFTPLGGRNNITCITTGIVTNCR